MNFSFDQDVKHAVFFSFCQPSIEKTLNLKHLVLEKGWSFNQTKFLHKALLECLILLKKSKLIQPSLKIITKKNYNLEFVNFKELKTKLNTVKKIIFFDNIDFSLGKKP